MKVDLVIGTRPEFIKLSPVARVMRKFQGIEPRIILTGQHKELLDGLPAFFDLEIYNERSVMVQGQSLASLTSKLLRSLEAQFIEDRPDVVLVQGDTTSAFIGALAAYYQQIPVCHVEAGLRTHDIYAPFPEEVNRTAIAQIAQVHFAPTKKAFKTLKNEGKQDVHLVGNTVIDAALFAQMRNRICPIQLPFAKKEQEKLVLVTAHRRESLEGGLEQIANAIITLHTQHPSLVFVVPMHANPKARTTLQTALASLDRVHLIEPLSYPEMIAAMDQAWLLMTDSGGLQEEAPTFHLPVLVLREKSERMEAIETGSAILCGTASSKLVDEVGRLLRYPSAYLQMQQAGNPFGDGKAAMRIAEIVKHTFKSPAPGL